MLKTVSGSAMAITVYHSYGDEALNLTDLKYTVYDAAGTVLAGPTSAPTFDPAAGETKVVIDAAYNETQAKLDIRSVVFELITADAGTYKTTEFYELEGDVLKLTPFIDSFMTYAESLIVQRLLGGSVGYLEALTDAQRAVALENAFHRLAALKFGNLGSTTSLLDLTPDQILALDPKFIDALKKAQILEANHLMESNPVRDKIKMGIISETIGESSMFFRQDAGLQLSTFPGISDDAYPLLSKYLFKETTNAQIWKLRRS